MKVIVYNSTQKTLIGYTLKCGMEDMENFLYKKIAKLEKNGKIINFYYDNIIRLDGRNFKVINPNNTIWVRVSEYLPVGVFGDVPNVIR